MYLTLIVLAVATWRLANLLADTEQSGPFRLLERLRSLVGVRFNPGGVPYGTTSLAEGLLCVYCSSVWFGTGWAVVWFLAPTWAFWLAMPFALSALAIVANKYFV